MICGAVQNYQLRPVEGKSGAIPFCTTTSTGLFIGDSQMKAYAFSECPWCYGDGCNQCSIERKKASEAAMEPIMTINLNDPDEVKLARGYIGRKAIENAFGPGGGGVREIERNAAIFELTKVLRKQNIVPPEEE